MTKNKSKTVVDLPPVEASSSSSATSLLSLSYVSLRTPVYFVIHDSRQVSLEHLLRSWYPFQSPPISTLRCHLDSSSSLTSNLMKSDQLINPAPFALDENQLPLLRPVTRSYMGPVHRSQEVRILTRPSYHLLKLTSLLSVY